jgi:hypothetical protein
VQRSPSFCHLSSGMLPRALLPEYEMDVQKAANWVAAVDVVGVRTHFYLDNNFLAGHLQLTHHASGAAARNGQMSEQTIVEGRTLLERAEKALALLRRKELSGARLVWRVAEEDMVKSM